MRFPSRLWLRAIVAVAVCPPTVAGAQDVAELQSQLWRAIDAGVPGATWGVMIASLDRGDTLFAIEPDAPLAPASNLKLLTTAAALRVLGPEHRFRTYVLTDGEVADGVVYGDLILYGTGDPGISDRFFRHKDDVFHRLIDQLEHLGIHTVTGDLVGDASFLPGPLRPEGWDPRDLNDHFSAAVSALSFNENVVSFRVVPSLPGAAPAVSTVPDHSGLEVLNHASTVAGGSRRRVHILREDPLDPARVEGQIVQGSRDVWRQMTVSVPAHFAVAVFRSTLESRGITVAGQLRVVDRERASAVSAGVTAPALGRRGTRVLAKHVSEPLSTYLSVVNKQSNNLFAELVFRTLGRTAEGDGSPEASARVVERELSAMGVDLAGVVQLDGSGLSAGNRVTAGTLVSVLRAMATDENWDVYWESLPEAGRRGGLGRMYRTAAAGNLRAKTGTIERVSALSGVVQSRDGERIAFSLLMNGARSTSRAKRVENRVGVTLASFRRHPMSSGSAQAVPALASADAPPDQLGGADRHQVASGESLSLIAARYRVTLDELIRANPGVQANRIFAGQWIDIPRRGGSE